MIQTEYFLKHKDDICGLMWIDPADGTLLRFSAKEPALLPFLGSADTVRMKQWWESRAIPGSRKTTEEVIRRAGCKTRYEYLAKNLALSLTDSYWLCPVEASLRWADVNLYHLKIKGSKLPYHNATSYDPNASLGGQMEKYWELGGEQPVLVKSAYRYHGQQSLNEQLATEIHKRQHTRIPFVCYETEKTSDGGILSKCDAFTSEQTEFVPAYEVVSSEKDDHTQSVYDSYIRICARHGMDRALLQDFMDYQTLTDFIISNSDEHLMNFGVLRDSNTMELIAPAPIFDSGNSMFYADERKMPYDRVSILERKITSFHDSEERMLSHVKNKTIVDMTCLPSPEEIRSFYASHGMPEERASFIAKGYAVKLALLRDFQSGKKISLYHEKKNPRP